MKVKNDKYYTPPALAKKLIGKTLEVIGKNNISDIVEPSAGFGSFTNELVYQYGFSFNDCTEDEEKMPYVNAFDIDARGHAICKYDYLQLPERYKKGRLYIGNPPFGDRNNLSLKFLKKNMLYGDYIAYIQPILSLGGSLQFYEFDLIHSEDLGIVNFLNGDIMIGNLYSENLTKRIPLHVCFNIWKRPENGKLNKKPNYKLNNIIIKEYRRNNKTYSEDKITLDFDYAICNWGNGTLGKVPEHVGQYAQEVYFYLKDKTKLNKLKELLEYDTIREYCKNISMKRICVARLYKYLKDNGFN